ncbi:hypothetical protein [Prosthecobacter sp.]|uniref:hypothetical protein n=1 Tax=Prosthecobacter sp. TaxID=1965333 RepID=UPI00378480AB
MTHSLLATTYPGGAGALISAILWLLLTAMAAVALVIGCFGFWRRFSGSSVPRSSLRLAVLTSLLALVFLVLEAGFVGWDAFFIIRDTSFFYEQFPSHFIRASLDLAALLPAWLAFRKMNPRVSQ